MKKLIGMATMGQHSSINTALIEKIVYDRAHQEFRAILTNGEIWKITRDNFFELAFKWNIPHPQLKEFLNAKNS